MSISSYKRKIIISGNIVEVYEYDKPILKGYKDTKKSSKGRQAIASDGDKEVNRDKVLNRARRDLRRLINSNIDVYGVPAKFVTLTFRDDIEDLKKANREFTKFIKRLKRYFDIDVKYAAVPEVQQERFEKYGVKVWHYHVIFFNLPYIKSNDLADIWRNGFIKINRIDRVSNVGAYICKYMTKDNKDLVGQKCYFTSRGLKKPVEIKEDERVDSLTASLPSTALTFESTFENEYNSVLYRQYNIKKS
jgi:hypothetical protein